MSASLESNSQRCGLFDEDFLNPSPASHVSYHDATLQALDVLRRAWPQNPYSGGRPAELADLLRRELLPARGLPLSEVLDGVAQIVEHSIAPSHPNVMAHLHCPPLITALAAEVILSALNQSMDSFDQAPAATIVEQMVVRMLRTTASLPDGADGVFTAGGSQSNYMALLLARDACIESRLGWDTRARGLPREAHRLRILCSEEAHFTVEKSAIQLGLGTDSVIRVAVDDGFRMRPGDLSKKLAELQSQNLIPMAVVATAGTTDFGSIDPLPEIAEIVRNAGVWLHVDGAYGGALLFSRHRGLLRGIELADSFSIDFHKLLWQPISCAALLLRDARQFRFLEMHSDYLNPENHEELGIPDLVTRSVLTSRRFDALKVWMTFQTLGWEKLSAMIDRTMELAQYAARTIRETEHLELLHDPQISCVVFRYLPCDPGGDANALNAAIRRSLFEEGRAVIGHTRVRGKQCLKLTILNPCVTAQMISDLLQETQSAGARAEAKARQTIGT